MPLYFLEHDSRFFHDQLAPALAACWRQRSFAPCLDLAASLVAAGRAFVPAQHDEQPLLAMLPALPFERDLWRLAAGEFLLFGARQVPLVPTTVDTLLFLAGAENTGMRQAHFGSHDVVFGGGFYRPDQAGLNDEQDVARLAGYLGEVDSAGWQPGQLVDLDVDPEDRDEELAYARECLAALRDLYLRATAEHAVIVCEQL